MGVNEIYVITQGGSPLKVPTKEQLQGKRQGRVRNCFPIEGGRRPLGAFHETSESQKENETVEKHPRKARLTSYEALM